MTREELKSLRPGMKVIAIKTETVGKEEYLKDGSERTYAEQIAGRTYTIQRVQLGEKIEDTCIWVDNYTFGFFANSYIIPRKKFHKVEKELKELLLSLYVDIEEHEIDEHLATDEGDVGDAGYYQGLKDAKSVIKNKIKKIIDIHKGIV